MAVDIDFLHFILLPTIGLLVASIGTLVGLGGGFVLVPILLIMFPEASPATISSISLTVVFLNAVSATIGNYKIGRIDFRTASLFSIGAIPAAAIGALVSTNVDRNTFDFLMGLMLLLGSLYVLWRSYKVQTMQWWNFKMANREITERIYNGKSFRIRFYVDTLMASAISPLSGFISSFFGIGGGVVNVPAMTFFLKMPPRVVAPTAMLLLVFTSSSSLLTRILIGQYHEGWSRAILLGMGALIGAQIGIYLSSKVNHKVILILLSISMALVGMRQILIGI
jgi:uncharacterized membrane protein YfcA